MSIRVRPYPHAEVPQWKTAFIRPLLMIKYPTIWIPGFMYGLNFSWDIGIAVIVGQLYQQIYHLKPPSVYLIYFSQLIACLIGEVLGGPWSDYIMVRFARARGGRRVPEARLHALYPGMTIMVVRICFNCAYRTRLMRFRLGSLSLQSPCKRS